MLSRKSFLQSTGILSASLLPLLSFSQGKTGESSTRPLLAKRSLSNSYWYIGHLLTVLLKSADTNGLFSLLRVTEIKGLEPPPHTHTREDEIFQLLDGEIEYTVGDQKFHAVAGDCMFLPRNIQHSFKVLTDRSEVMVLLTPGGFEEFFIEMSEPAPELKPAPIPSAPPDIARIKATGIKFGIIFPK